MARGLQNVSPETTWVQCGCYKLKPMKVVFREQEWLTHLARAVCVSGALCASPSPGPRGCEAALPHPRTQRSALGAATSYWGVPFLSSREHHRELTSSPFLPSALWFSKLGICVILKFRLEEVFLFLRRSKANGKKTKLCLIYNARASSFLSYADDPSAKITISRNLEEETVVPVALT